MVPDDLPPSIVDRSTNGTGRGETVVVVERDGRSSEPSP